LLPSLETLHHPQAAAAAAGTLLMLTDTSLLINIIRVQLTRLTDMIYMRPTTDALLSLSISHLISSHLIRPLINSLHIHIMLNQTCTTLHVSRYIHTCCGAARRARGTAPHPVRTYLESRRRRRLTPLSMFRINCNSSHGLVD